MSLKTLNIVVDHYAVFKATTTAFTCKEVQIFHLVSRFINAALLLAQYKRKVIFSLGRVIDKGLNNLTGDVTLLIVE